MTAKHYHVRFDQGKRVHRKPVARAGAAPAELKQIDCGWPSYILRDPVASQAASVCASCPSGQLAFSGCRKAFCGALEPPTAANLRGVVLGLKCPLGHHDHLRPSEGGES